MFFARILNGTIYNALINTGSPNGQFTVTLRFCIRPRRPFRRSFRRWKSGRSPNSVFFDRNFKAAADQSGRPDGGAGSGLEYGDERDLAGNVWAAAAELHRPQPEPADYRDLYRDRYDRQGASA